MEYNMRMSTPLQRVFDNYALRIGVPVDQLRFEHWDDRKLKTRITSVAHCVASAMVSALGMVPLFSRSASRVAKRMSGSAM